MSPLPSYSELEMVPPIDPIDPYTWPDLTFEEFLTVASTLPAECPCPECLADLNMSSAEYAIHYRQQLENAWLLLTEYSESYEPPPLGPTNQEMHAINGNHKQLKTDYTMGMSDLFKGVSELTQELPHTIPRLLEEWNGEGQYDGEDGYQSYKNYFANSKDRPEPGEKEYNKWKKLYEAEKRSKKLRSQVKNFSDRIPIPSPKITPVTHNKTEKWDWQPNHDGVLNAETTYDSMVAGENPAEIIQNSGPTNQEMHSYNGNININPIASAMASLEKIAKKKSKNKRRPPPKRQAPRKTRTIRKARPKPKLPAGVKAAGKVEKLEIAVARKYSSFLRNPVFTPPRLGSTGNSPTMLVHGYFRKTYNMAAPFGTVANATCVSANINPALFKQVTSKTSYAAPIVISFTTTGSIVPTVANATGDVSIESFVNEAALKNQVLGSTTINLPNPLARWVGGSISLQCRCPMTTTAPPFLFGGLLPEFPIDTDGYVRKDSQLSSFAIDNVKNLEDSAEVAGFSVSSVYIPNTPNALNFDAKIAQYATTGFTPVTAIPYVGMTNCPTSAVVEITVSGWFEVQQNTYYSGGTTINTADYGGWGIGPRVSSEDIYDNLRRFQPVSKRIIGMGAKTSGSSGLAALVAARDQEHIPPQLSLQDEVSFLRKQYELLRLKLEDEEDEKFIQEDYTSHLDQCDTPQYRGLSKSTIDLAMSIKKSLTPGSVTNKTVLTSAA